MSHRGSLLVCSDLVYGRHRWTPPLCYEKRDVETGSDLTFGEENKLPWLRRMKWT